MMMMMMIRMRSAVRSCLLRNGTVFRPQLSASHLSWEQQSYQQQCTTAIRFHSTDASSPHHNDHNESQQSPQAQVAYHYSDVMIVGGGVAGCALARLLNQRLPALSVHLVEARDGPPPPPPLPLQPSENTTNTQVPHPRSYALSPQSLRILGLLEEDDDTTDTTANNVPLGWYDSMQIWEARNPATLRFHTDDLPFDEKTLENPKMLGAVVEDSAIVRKLWNELQQHAQTTLSTNTTVTDILPSSTNNNNNNTQGLVTVETSNGNVHQTRLLVAADGAQSPIRQRLGIPQVQWDYGRHALTFTVELADNDNVPRTAYQRFVHGHGQGPLALLPTHSPKHAIVVWSTTPDVVQHWKTTNDNNQQALVDHLNKLLQQGPQRLPPLVDRSNYNATANTMPPLFSKMLFEVERVLETVQDAGAMAAATASPTRAWMAPPLISSIASPKLSFPLACRTVSSYLPSAHDRVVVIGDAAHTVHPMAGQGLNLGLAAVESLVQALEETEAVGMDMTRHSLNKYLQQRHALNATVLLGIHALHEMFALTGDHNTPFMHAKSFGMNVLQQVGPLRRKIVQAATQGVLL